jgi:hypothetical protein
MAEVSRFYGIVIRMYFDDHMPPHFHADYGGLEAVVSIHPLGVLRGKLPRRALRLVRRWAGAHRMELQANWDRARAGGSIEQIEPLV